MGALGGQKWLRGKKEGLRPISIRGSATSLRSCYEMSSIDIGRGRCARMGVPGWSSMSDLLLWESLRRSAIPLPLPPYPPLYWQRGIALWWLLSCYIAIAVSAVVLKENGYGAPVWLLLSYVVSTLYPVGACMKHRGSRVVNAVCSYSKSRASWPYLVRSVRSAR
eukprot:369123-Rhodomonas_salina.1